MPWFQYNGSEIVRDNCASSTPPFPVDQVKIPVATFAARNAPMDVVFFPDSKALAEYRDDAIVALHGSWAVNRQGGQSGGAETRRPPKLVRVEFDDDQVIGVRDFVTGFQLSNGKRWARPMGVAFDPEGDLYVTSDSANQGLYRLRRIRYNPAQ
jgi:glucose/arabinose dehydrogenase